MTHYVIRLTGLRLPLEEIHSSKEEIAALSRMVPSGRSFDPRFSGDRMD